MHRPRSSSVLAVRIEPFAQPGGQFVPGFGIGARAPVQRRDPRHQPGALQRGGQARFAPRRLDPLAGLDRCLGGVPALA